jgi:hypothetical protein
MATTDLQNHRTHARPLKPHANHREGSDTTLRTEIASKRYRAAAKIQVWRYARIVKQIARQVPKKS